MLTEERWVKHTGKLDMHIVQCLNYDHKTFYTLPVPPSPNLKTMTSVYLYPSLCFFEGTTVSVGRGTAKPFQQWGHPFFSGKSDYYFIPKATTGASKPLHENQRCFGMMIADDSEDAKSLMQNQLNIQWLVQAYQWYPEKARFFNSFFEKLTGTSRLRTMIEKGMSAEEIRASWQKEVNVFKNIRRKYLLYDDFE